MIITLERKNKLETSPWSRVHSKLRNKQNNKNEKRIEI